ncbi:MAG TPA: hypothetical protein VFG42_17220 [Baekduia sp.]|uniref:hypothetical protein n=1 Tax=Baekduia sp. TaxID=2600305 RepID=UPI002D77D9E5|nr:hypothetical protein [Baekduia sp.]HET6508536.1 hypothetical protein [Baekduia sp.]
MLRPFMLAVVAALVLAAPAAAETQTASLGAVSATFSYTKVDDFQYSGMDVQITRAGAVAYTGVASGPGCAPPYCAPGGAVGGSALRVADLDGDGEPEVLVDLYTGGAHCCTIAEIFRWTGSTYATTTRDFADFGYTLNGGTFVTGDVRFAYSFASFADSAMPVRLLAFKAGTFSDVTRAHPATLRADAARWLKEYKKRRGGTRALGLLAAWVADEYRLGASGHAAADRFLTAELRAGRLRADQGWPHGKAYISALKRRLRAWGYGG